MTVGKNIEAILRNYYDNVRPNFFEIENDENGGLHLVKVIEGFSNNWYQIDNIVFDINDDNIFIEYNLNNNNYRFSMHNNQDFTLEQNSVLLIIAFTDIYNVGIELKVLSEHEDDFTHANYSYSIRKI